MNTTAKVAAAVASGYLLGRTKKLARNDPGLAWSKEE